jgi:FkbM family methyltransferase
MRFEYMKYLIRFCEKIIKEIAVKFSGRIYCQLFNLRALIFKIDVRFVYHKKGKIYSAKSSKYERFFFEKNQNWISYRKGISTRAEDLGVIYFLDLIEFEEDDLVVDCGANVGDLELYFREKNTKIKYIGIEPSPKEFQCLELNTLNKFNINVGLWHENSILEFFISSSKGDSSFIEPVEYSNKVDVKAQRLDSLLSKPIKLLKLEAEGAEPEILAGSENLLDQIQYISADLGFERGVSQESTFPAVVNILLKNRFEIVAVGYPRFVALFKNTSKLST